MFAGQHVSLVATSHAHDSEPLSAARVKEDLLGLWNSGGSDPIRANTAF